MSDWNHPMCLPCWRKREGDADPTRLIDAQMEWCCWCERPTSHGIYVREAPTALPKHRSHLDD